MKRRRVVVIGGGLAGSLLCNELSQRADVTLLEVGERDRVSYPRIAFDRKKLAHVPTFCLGGGGTTNLWHNGLMPINPNDVAGQEFRGVVAEARAFMDAAATSLFFKGQYSLTYAEAMREAATFADHAGIHADGVDCLIYPKAYRKLTVDRRVQDVYAVTGIRFTFAGRRLTTVNYRSGDGEHSIDTDEVIVAAGAMGSPKVLGDLIAASGHRHETLGAGLVDHPIGFVGKVRLKKHAAHAVKRLSFTDKGDYVVRSALRLKSDCGRYTCCVFLRPAMTMQNSLAIYKYKSLLGASTGLARLKHALSWKLFHPDIVAEVFSHLFGVHLPSRTYNVLLVAEQRRGTNRVHYNGDELRVDWSISSEELEIYRSVLRRLRDVLRDVAEEIDIETNLTDDWLWSGAHHSGTTPVGADVADLVDRDLKLKFCENVYVCDGSVIQEHSYANTGLTIAQLALRLAGRLVAVS